MSCDRHRRGGELAHDCGYRPSRPAADVTSGPTEVDPVLRAPLPQSRFLGLVREIVPQVEGAPPHQQILISAVSASTTSVSARCAFVRAALGIGMHQNILAADLFG